eukprot:Colp12_sorted_trinity150504_noHs@31555
MAGDGDDRKQVIFAVGFYFVTSTSMVMANKWVLNSSDIPILFLWLQLVVAVVCLYICQLAGMLKLPHIEYDKARALFPLIAVNCIGLTFNTLCLRDVDASFFQVARGLVLPCTVALTWVMLKTPSSPAVLVSCAIVCAGFFTGAGEVNVRLIGVIYGAISSVTTALHAVVIKQSLKVVENTMDLVYYNSVLSALGLLPIVIVRMELGPALDLFVNPDLASSRSTFIWGCILTGFIGFLINIAGFLQIKVTSPVTHMISSAVRGVGQAFVAMALFGDVMSVKRAVGISLILLGSCAYTWIRHLETEREKPSSGTGSKA